MSKAVMTIHGFLTEINDFDRLYDYLGCYDEIIPVKIPGHNDDVDFSMFTVDSTFEIVLKTYDWLRSRNDEVDVVGFSMGGALTTWLCTQRDVHRAVLIAPANKYLNPALPLEVTKFVGSLNKKATKGAKGGVRDKLNAIKQELDPYVFNVKVSKDILLTHIIKHISPHTFGVFRKLMKLSNTSVELASPVNTPTLVLWGKLDELVPYKSVTYVLEHFPNACEKVYSDIGHAMLYTNRDHLLIKDIMVFLTEGKFNKEIPERESDKD